MDYGVSLGRRFRSLKLWFVLRYFGRQGIAARIRRHLELARELAGWIDADDDWRLMAPVELAAVAFRYTPEGTDTKGESVPGSRDVSGTDGASRSNRSSQVNRANQLNRAILDRVNATGEAFLTHTSLDGRVALRVAIGNLNTTREDVERVWGLLRAAAAEVAASRA